MEVKKKLRDWPFIIVHLALKMESQWKASKISESSNVGTIRFLARFSYLLVSVIAAPNLSTK